MIKNLLRQVRGPERWLLFTKGSILLNLGLALGKLAVGVVSGSIFLCINAFYNAGMAAAKRTALYGYRKGHPDAETNEPQREYPACLAVGAIVLASSAIYIIYCLRLFLFGSDTRYSDIVSITIAAFTFTEIGLAVYGVAGLRHGREPAMLAVKLVNLATSLISLVLTQSALLSFTAEGDSSFYNGLSGMLFGGCAMLIGLGMMLRVSRVMRQTNIN